MLQRRAFVRSLSQAVQDWLTATCNVVRLWGLMGWVGVGVGCEKESMRTRRDDDNAHETCCKSQRVSDIGSALMTDYDVIPHVTVQRVVSSRRLSRSA